MTQDTPPLPAEQPLPPPVRDRLWSLYGHIVRRWSDADPATMRSNWLVFVANRQRVDARYAGWYAEAATLLDGMVARLGEAAAYEQLLTDPAGVPPPGQPPATPLARARQRVSGEFITLFLSLGGFKAYGAVNYLGYIAGTNAPGRPPYRTAQEGQP